MCDNLLSVIWQNKLTPVQGIVGESLVSKLIPYDQDKVIAVRYHGMIDLIQDF